MPALFVLLSILTVAAMVSGAKTPFLRRPKKNELWNLLLEVKSLSPEATKENFEDTLRLFLLSQQPPITLREGWWLYELDPRWVYNVNFIAEGPTNIVEGIYRVSNYEVAVLEAANCGVDPYDQCKASSNEYRDLILRRQGRKPPTPWAPTEPV